MSAKILKVKSDGISIQVDFKFGKSMLENEENIANALNEAGEIATREALSEFDADGAPIIIGDQVFSSKGKFNKEYQTPYGKIVLPRYIYQSQSGGKTFCPLENDARIITTSTPRFAKMISSKYSFGGARTVKKDLRENHCRDINVSTLQDIAEAVGLIALAKEESWEYIPRPKEVGPIGSISIGIDGACMRMKDDGWREAMTGTIALYDQDGNRVHTTYVAAPPEYGKGKFLKSMREKMNKVAELFPGSTTVGLADGAKGNWEFLNSLTEYQILDFYHATEYLGSFSKATIKKDSKRKEWMKQSCHNLKHKSGAATRLLNHMGNQLSTNLSKSNKQEVQRAAIYFSNNRHRMKYKKMRDMNLPIGSGVTEAACKVIIKERMCKSGASWADKGAGIVLKLRCMNNTEGHWSSFWSRVDKCGYSTDLTD